jgi:hypothetical protein
MLGPLFTDALTTMVFYFPLKHFLRKIDWGHQRWVDNTIVETVARCAAARFNISLQESIGAIKMADPTFPLYRRIHNGLVRCEVAFWLRARRSIVMSITLNWANREEDRFEQEQLWEAVDESIRLYLQRRKGPYIYEWYLPERIR